MEGRAVAGAVLVADLRRGAVLHARGGWTGGAWVFKKVRVLAIFDDLDTILFMIPLKALMVGMMWQLAVIALVIAVVVSLASFRKILGA